ncbi:6266_t:CDS:1, partial [Rhizophagus irregularis]
AICKSRWVILSHIKDLRVTRLKYEETIISSEVFFVNLQDWRYEVVTYEI